MKHSIIFSFLLYFISAFIYSQSKSNVSGLFVKSDDEPVSNVNVLLLNANDSTLVKGAVTLVNGTYQFEHIDNGEYLIMGSIIGYQIIYSKRFDLIMNYNVETLRLSEGESLEEIVVEAVKPLYQQKVDRLVINVENSIVSAGGSALEILERSPGVTVNRIANSISIAGKAGVIVMINGRRSYLPPSALVQLLDGMSADNIETIELITTPPSNFDAEGNAGFINIILKQRTDVGLNGSYSISFGYGGNGSLTSDNINFNYRKYKLNFFGNYSYSNNNQESLFRMSQEREENSTIYTASTISNRFPKRPVHNLRLGLDYQLTDNTIMGVLINGYTSKWSMDALTDNFLSKNGVPESYVELILDEVNHWKHFGANYNIKHNFTKNKFVSFNIDYLYYKDNNPINYLNSYFDENHNLLEVEKVRSRKLTPIKAWVANFDYSNQINERVKLETGAKGSLSTFDNDVSVETFINNEWNFDSTLTNKSDLVENIYAAYTSVEYKINEKWSSKFGLRYEYTDSQLSTVSEGVIIDKKYGKLFPTVYFNRKFNDSLNMNFSYSRRISRPSFGQMAPFTIMWDPNTFTIGNEKLQPSISDSFKYDLNYKSIILSLQYTYEDSSIAGSQITYDEINDRVIMRSENLDYAKYYSITIGAPIKITNWWRTQNNLNYFYNEIKAFNSNDEPYDLSSRSFSVNSVSSFKFLNDFSGEIYAFYSGPSYYGTSKTKEYYNVSIGLQKKFSDKWGSLRFAVNDVFDIFEYVRVTNIPDQNLKITNNSKFNHRTFYLTYTRKFGNSKLKSSRYRRTGSEEERRRVN